MPEETIRLLAEFRSAEEKAEQAAARASSIKRKLLDYVEECVVSTSAAFDSAKKARADLLYGKHSFHIPDLISNIVSLLLLVINTTSERLLALNFEEETDPEEERKAIGETARGEASEDARNKKQEQELRQQEWLSVCLFYFSYSVYINNQYLL